MPEPYELDKLLLRTADQLDDKERDFIKQNVDKLNDEDKEAYASFLTEEEPEAPAQPETPADPEKPEEPEAPATPATPEAPTTFTFKTEEEVKEFVKKQLEEEKRLEKEKAEKEKQAAEGKRFVPDGYQPKDWNEAYKNTDEMIEKKLEEREQKRIAKRLEDEWKDLSKEKNLPSLETTEGKQIHDNIVKFGVAAGKQTFKEAYDVWATVPKSFGGGFDPEAKKEPTNEPSAEDKLKKQKQAASKVGGANDGTPARQPGGITLPSYKQVKESKSTNQLLKELGYI